MLGSSADRTAAAPRWRFAPIAARAVLVYAVLWLAGWKAAQAGEVIDFVSIWYLPAGISFGFLLLYGPRFLPFVLAMEVATSLALHPSMPALWTIVPLIVACGYGAAALAVHHWGRAKLKLASVRDVGWVIGAGAVAAGAVAVLGSVLYVGTGVAGSASYGESVLTWWLGDLLGILVATPVLVQIGARYLEPQLLAAGAVAGARQSWDERVEPIWGGWRALLTRRAMPLRAGYAAAVLMPVLFVIVRAPFESYLGTAPFLFLFPAISIAAFIGGLGPGLVSVGLSSGIAVTLYLDRQDGLALTPQSATLLVFFVLVAALQVFILDRLHDAMRRAKRAGAREQLLRREVQHRAANIMQIAIAMVSLQARSEDEAGRKALASVEQRLHTLAETQRRLSASPISSDPGLLEEIAGDVLRSMAGGRIGCTLRFDRGLALGPEQVQCLGLIIGELITNCVKHAFAADEAGGIEITLTAIGPDTAELTYCDTGRPFPPSPAGSGSGMRLIGALAAQMGGSVERTIEPDKKIAVRFPIARSR
jgi:two-component sensor histidine kinase